MSTWSAGDNVLDRYRLVERLAEGGGGESWAAEGPRGAVVIKKIHSEDRRRFRDLMREAQVLRELRHPNVVAYREFSDRPDEDCAILVTDFVEGGDLEAWVSLVGPRVTSEVAALGLQIVTALEVLAAEDVLHRDLKPANVLVAHDEPPVLRVADFGISRPLTDGIAQTQDRSLTPQYAAPEQHTGAALTSAADLYALGGILAFLATGRHPTMGGMPTGDVRLDPLLERLLALSPAARPTLAQTRSALEAIREGRPLPVLDTHQTLAPNTFSPDPVSVVASREGRPRGLPDASRRWRSAAIFAALLVPLLLGIVAVTVSSSAPEAPRPAPTALAPTVSDVVPPPEPAPEREPEPAPVEAPAVEPRAETVEVESAVLFVNSRPWSTVYVDGARVGTTGEVGQRFDVVAGEHEVRLEADGVRTWTTTIEISGERRLCVALHSGTEVRCSS